MKVICEVFYLEIEFIVVWVVVEIGMGNVVDKILKNMLVIEKMLGVEDLYIEVVIGDNGMMFYEFFLYGVIGVVVLSMNLMEILICNIIGMFVVGNVVFYSLYLGVKNIFFWLIEKLNMIVCESCGIDNLVVIVEKLFI